MVRDIINYVQSRVGEIPRERILLELNTVWSDLWSAKDLPGSERTMFVNDYCCDGSNGQYRSARVSLPYYVQDLRAAKVYLGPQVELNQPAQAFNGGKWFTNPLTWNFIGESPLEKIDFNRAPPRLTVSVKPTTEFDVVIIGSTKNRDKVREVITFEQGQVETIGENSFVTYESITKEVLTDSNILGYDGEGEQIFTLANSMTQARNTIWQTRGENYFLAWNNWISCCYQILYKCAPTYLYYDEDAIFDVRYETVLQDLVVSKILATRKGDEQRAGMFASDAGDKLTNISNKATAGIDNMLRVDTGKFVTSYRGLL
jgi:hypothetical protein